MFEKPPLGIDQLPVKEQKEIATPQIAKLGPLEFQSGSRMPPSDAVSQEEFDRARAAQIYANDWSWNLFESEPNLMAFLTPEQSETVAKYRKFWVKFRELLAEKRIETGRQNLIETDSAEAYGRAWEHAYGK